MMNRRPHECLAVMGGLVFLGFSGMASERSEHDHWSLKPLERPDVPAEAGIGRHPVDAFIEARLATDGWAAGPEADRRTLLRRVFIDLAGLPPTPDEVEAFERDPDPAAYEAVVDRLLASPRHGERWARHWLDTIHFADTHGFEHDVFRPHAWRFRDYVIQAFNADTPWPRFIREQLAADRFYPDEPRLTAALGFLGAGTYDMSAEGTAYASFEYVDRDDLVTQTMAAFVSTTAQCARCHAHKFDPITQEDYFSLQAVFAGVGKGDVEYDEDAAVATARRRWSRLRDLVAVAGPDGSDALLAPEWSALVDEWEARWIAAGSPSARWEPLKPAIYAAAVGATLQRMDDDSILSTGKSPDTETYVVTAASPLPEIIALKLEAMTDDSLPHRGPGRLANGNFHLTEIELQVFRKSGEAPELVRFQRATADFDQPSFAAPGAIDGDPKTSWAIHPRVGEPHSLVAVLAAPVTLAEGDKIVISLKQFQGGQHLIGRFRLSVTDALPGDVTLVLPERARTALAQPASERSPEVRKALAGAVLRVRAADELAALPPMAKVWAASAEAQRERGQKAGFAQPRVIRVFARGDIEKPGAEVSPGALTAVSALPSRFQLPDPSDESARRAALADWIAHPNNPLTWRSIVNRVWHYHFGRGLCDTPSDFGRMGGTPTHPELLDWLAIWFRDDAGGSPKKLHRLIVTSAAYRRHSDPQSLAISEPIASTATPAGLAPVVERANPRADFRRQHAEDPDNHRLWRAQRARLDAETYRDAVMAISRRLDLTMGGPGIRHFRSSPGPQSTPVLDYVDFDWSQPGVARRSIYRVVWRGIPDPFMDGLDFPDMGLLSPARGFSASPLQSLALLNNPFVLHHAEALAAWTAGSASDANHKVQMMVRAVWLRDASAEELAEFRELADAHGFSALARLLFNSNEFLFVN
ncbi:MAG: DUF1549 and DUF1553 domain-containing protein [Verrucomicrobiales bacterium]